MGMLKEIAELEAELARAVEAARPHTEQALLAKAMLAAPKGGK